MNENIMNNKIYFKLDALCAGNLVLEFGNKNEKYYYCFDENLTDAIPNMLKMYNKLKNNEDYEFEAFYNGEIKFSVKFLDENTIELKINYRYNDEKADFIDKVHKNKCIDMIDKLFDDILNNKDFPHQFPCFEDLDDKEYEKYGLVADKIFEELVEKKFCDDDLDIWDVIDNVICRELVSIRPNGIEYYNIYKEMLKTRTLPEGWAKKR